MDIFDDDLQVVEYFSHKAVSKALILLLLFGRHPRAGLRVEQDLGAFETLLLDLLSTPLVFFWIELSGLARKKR